MSEINVLNLVDRISAGSAIERDLAADEVTDVHKALSDQEIDAVTTALVAARLVEKEARCQEAQLHALCELKAWHALRGGALDPLRRLREGGPLGPQDEYLDDLFAIE